MSVVFMKTSSGIADRCKAFATSLDEAGKEAVRNWHKDVFPDHFQQGAARKYKYKPRTKGYQKEKRKKGSPPALVLSGYSKRMLTRRINVTGKKGTIRGKFKSSQFMRYFWMVPKKHPNKPQEMKALLDSEVKTMNADIRNGTAKRLRKFRAKRRF